MTRPARRSFAAHVGRGHSAYVFELLGIGIAYFVLAKIGLTLASINSSTSAIWPATGFALAAVLLWGYRVAPAVLIASFAANVTNIGSISEATAIAYAQALRATGQYSQAAAVLQQASIRNSRHPGVLGAYGRALADGGRAVTLEFMPNPDRVSPPQAAAFSLMMLGGTPGGDAYTYAELETMFRNAGFAHSEWHELPPTIQRVVISNK